MAEVEDSDGNSAAQSLAVAAPEKVSNYLKKVVPVILEDYEGLESSSLEAAFADKNVQDALKKFIGDPQSRALLVSRHLSITEEDESDRVRSGDYRSHLGLQAQVGVP